MAHYGGGLCAPNCPITNRVSGTNTLSKASNFKRPFVYMSNNLILLGGKQWSETHAPTRGGAVLAGPH